MALADFRGRIVVLTLLDPDCTDICPICASHFRLAHQALGTDAAKVAFLAFTSTKSRAGIS